MSDGRLEPLRQPAAPLRRKIIAALRDAIERGILEPGARLVERDLCERLAVSRTSLREALRALTAEGIVSPAPDRGLMVTRLTPDDVRNAYDIWGQLEALAAEHFIARADDAERSQLVLKGRALVEAYREGSVAAILEATRNFRDLLYSGARNSVLRDILSQLALKTSAWSARAVSRLERQHQGIGEIEAIVGAICDRDIVQAQAASIRHVANMAASALAIPETGRPERASSSRSTAATLAA